MAKVLIIIAQNGFHDEELIVPREVLERSGHSVKVASVSRSKAIGSNGAIVQPDLAVYEANPDFFDAVIIAGGPGSRTLSENQEVLQFVMEASSKNKVMGAICLGPMTLAKAGVLAGKNATVFHEYSAIKMLRENAGIYKEDYVVVDGKVITADSPSSAGRFGAGIVALLKSKNL